MIIEDEAGTFHSHHQGGPGEYTPAEPQQEYHVTWEIDLSADSPAAAAAQALAIHRDPDSQATVFGITGPEGKRSQVDLSKQSSDKIREGEELAQVCPFCGEEVRTQMVGKDCDEWIDVCPDHGVIEGQAITRAAYERADEPYRFGEDRCESGQKLAEMIRDYFLEEIPNRKLWIEGPTGELPIKVAVFITDGDNLWGAS